MTERYISLNHMAGKVMGGGGLGMKKLMCHHPLTIIVVASSLFGPFYCQASFSFAGPTTVPCWMILLD